MTTSCKIFTSIMIITMATILTINFNANIFASSTLSTSNGKAVKVGVLWTNLYNPFVNSIDEGLKDIQNKTKNNISFTFYDGKNNLAIQNEQIDSLLRNNIDLLIIDLVDKKEDVVKDVIDKIFPTNIPVIFLNVDSTVAEKFSSYYKNKIVFMAEDFKKPAMAQGKIIVDAWNANKQNVDKNGDGILQYVMLSGEHNNPITNDRTQYSIKAINDAGIKTEQLALYFAKWDKQLAKDAINSLFLQYDGHIEAIIANNDNMAIGAIEALQTYGYNKGNTSKNILVVGFDGLPEAKDLIDKGVMTGTIIQDPATVSEALYKIGMNLVNKVDPLENTNYKLSKTGIEVEFPHYEYIKKSNIP
ncbi:MULTISPECIES: galactose ABC transporter substrate-binding protein [unclassified Clostridium]|uniref:galactose ABC transporter substrate-binding protein n=1 Tax=unclassified Clostridium TaxID=2614128 RepID=UPI00029773C1|nr:MULTISPECIES: galactose ABC transporter substrate-binding protein [unclassified Clostridium]EKQ57145.1 MAG: ABC-type sugar transport system, periplasmic component [Clostridium sp. Maddingley MBC34-26]